MMCQIIKSTKNSVSFQFRYVTFYIMSESFLFSIIIPVCILLAIIILLLSIFLCKCEKKPGEPDNRSLETVPDLPVQSYTEPKFIDDPKLTDAANYGSYTVDSVSCSCSISRSVSTFSSSTIKGANVPLMLPADYPSNGPLAVNPLMPSMSSVSSSDYPSVTNQAKSTFVLED